jgi:hypothetical protein
MSSINMALDYMWLVNSNRSSRTTSRQNQGFTTESSAKYKCVPLVLKEHVVDVTHRSFRRAAHDVITTLTKSLPLSSHYCLAQRQPQATQDTLLSESSSDTG